MTSLGGVKRRAAAIWSLVGLLDVLLAPGVIAHELGHVAMCRILGVDVHEVTLYQLPQTAFTPKRPARGRVRHDPTRSPWKSLLIALGPLMTNTVGALVALKFTSQLVLAVEFDAQPSTLGAFVATNARYFFQHTSPVEWAVVGGGFWIASAMAVTAMPSTTDALNAVSTAFKADERVNRITYWPAVALFLLSSSPIGFGSLYGYVLLTVGMGGIDVAFEMYRSFTFYVVVGLFIGAVEGRSGFVTIVRSRLRHPDRPIPEVTPVVLQRADLLKERATAGESLSDEDVAYLVEHLENRYKPVRKACARALRTVATEEPTRVARWEDEILERWRQERSDAIRYHLLVVLLRRAEHTAAPAELRDVALEVVVDDSSRVRRAGMQFTAHLAVNDPAVFGEHADELVETLTDDGVPDDEKSNLSLTILQLAQHDPATLTPHRDDLEPYAASSNETVARRISEALEAIVDAPEDAPERQN